jgi:hypothetical protein
VTAGTDQGSRGWVKQTACICSCLMITEHKQFINPVIIYEILPKFLVYQLLHKRVALKIISKFILKQPQHVLVYSPSSGSVLFELAKVTVVKIIN